MKVLISAVILATIGHLAALSHCVVVADASPLERIEKRQQKSPGQQWCDAFNKSCVVAAREVCGGNNQSKYSCDVYFNNNVCTAYTVACACQPTGGSVTDATKSALAKTFDSTMGTCSSLPINAVPPSSSVPGPQATPTSASLSASSVSVPSPSSTSAGPKSDAAKFVMTSSTIAFAAALSLGILVL